MIGEINIGQTTNSNNKLYLHEYYIQGYNSARGYFYAPVQLDTLTKIKNYIETLNTNKRLPSFGSYTYSTSNAKVYCAIGYIRVDEIGVSPGWSVCAYGVIITKDTSSAITIGLSGKTIGGITLITEI